ncbi:S1 RNA-binding domain-containing protein [Ruminococcus sp. NK3A76]|uniref:S1 RNA-binding domain-containing protein n=1 Tax=Ruminococcus sp. NK3A76 TaxID=877411 RepID=UPI00048A6F4D|nr:S1 RNA-binding domain-containing protein [Ruminococcus sp. NK3A76]
MERFYPEGYIKDRSESEYYLKTPERLAEAAAKGLILEARAAVCSKEHDLYVELPFCRAVIPREEGALGISDGSVRDIAILSRVGKPVCFVPLSVGAGGAHAVLSRRAAQQRCTQEYLSLLSAGDIIDACVTHLEPFGAFADIGCGICSLIPIDAISVSRIAHPADRFYNGMPIKAVVKGREGGRICLSHKELLGTWEQNAERFTQGETVSGIIRSVESYGVFIELAPNLAGLAEPFEGAKAGMSASVYIKAIIPEKMKIKLIVVDVFDSPAGTPEIEYFTRSGRLGRWDYSVKGSQKEIYTQFA